MKAIFERIKKKKLEQEKRKLEVTEKEKDNIKNESKENENKEIKEEKQEKVSFLTALFESRKNQSISQTKNNTPKRRTVRRKKKRDVENDYQRKIDSYLIGNEEGTVGKPTQAKRKRENHDEKEIGTLITPKKMKNRKENKKSGLL